MCKKLVILGIVGFIAVSAVRGSKIESYLRSELASLRERAESNIPPEKEIVRLRNEVKNLDKDIMVVVNQLAKERVEVNQLREKTDELRARQSKEKELLNARAAAIKNATEQVIFGDRKLSVNAAKSELEESVTRYSTNQKSLEALELALGSREKIRDGLEKQLETMKNQKSELTATVDALEAQLTALKLRQMESKYQNDDTRLARIKEDIRALKTKLEVEREKLKLLPAIFETTDKASSTKSVDDIMAPLTAQPKPTSAKPEAKMPVVE
jgi:chromosome segregation ATPase